MCEEDVEEGPAGNAKKYVEEGPAGRAMLRSMSRKDLQVGE